MASQMKNTPGAVNSSINNPPATTHLPAPNSPEGDALLEAARIGETRFFRETAPLLAWRDEVLFAERQPVRILSVGCSTGEEPYTVAMLFSEWGAADLLREVVGVDISRAAIAAANVALYPPESLSTTSRRRRSAFFRPLGDSFVVEGAVRRNVSIVHGNLLGALGATGRFDLILCRNLMIYFDAASQCRAAERLSRHLSPGGYLLAGLSEVLLPWAPLTPRQLGRSRLHQGAP